MADRDYALNATGAEFGRRQPTSEQLQVWAHNKRCRAHHWQADPMTYCGDAVFHREMHECVRCGARAWWECRVGEPMECVGFAPMEKQFPLFRGG